MALIRSHACRQSIKATSLWILLLVLTFPITSFADTISGTVRDPSGAVIPGAHIEISGGDLAQPAVVSTDNLGNFNSPQLKPGSYTVRVSHDGFETLNQAVTLSGTATLQLTLAIARQEVSVAVTGKSVAYFNSDPVYRQLRGLGFGETYHVDHYTLAVDVGTFQFEKGSITFLAPVNGIVTGAVFVGQGHFNLKPVLAVDASELSRRIGAAELNEDFTSVVFRFTADGKAKFSGGLGDRAEISAEAADVFVHWRERVRHRHEEAQSFTQAMLEGESMDNVDADVLAAIYNEKHPPFVNAYIRGSKHKDLRFLVRSRVGALPELDSPEEVAVVNYDPMGMEEGVWYLSHFQSEFTNHTANSREDRRLFATRSYKIETDIGKNRHLYANASITFDPLVEGERVMKFSLLPNLRVTRVTDDAGQDLYFIQEGRKDDGSFYAILGHPSVIGQPQTIKVEYSGDKVLESAGGGSFYVRARTSWYPNLNGFGEKATYDLTFKVPKRYKVISVGKLQGESLEGDLAVSHWLTPVAVAVAGFNYGEYKKLDLDDQTSGFKISGYYLEDLPDNLRSYSALQSMAPKSMSQYAVNQTRASLQLYNYYYGKTPYDTIAITEQPDFNFGQSWPNLVYLPISAYTDSTQRFLLFGGNDRRFTGFVEEVTPHEVAHQWWGHAVSWASYHDQWLSEGFAEFSAGLFLQKGVAGDWRKDYLEFWERLRKRILDKNNFGFAPNDAGPLWMGLRLMAPKTESAYQNVTYPKGAYVLEMLRSIMYSNQDQDKAFMDMMHDFVESHRDRPASTESFKAIVEKHMTAGMDLQQNKHMDWFFREWVYGTQVPRYHMDYQVTPADGGKFKLEMKVTQSEVDENFAMIVPVYGDFGKGMMRLGQFPIVGSSTRNIDVLLPAQPKKVQLNAFKEVLERY